MVIIVIIICLLNRNLPKYNLYCIAVLFCLQQKREEEYERFLRDKLVLAKTEFKTLLKETKMIDYQ